MTNLIFDDSPSPTPSLQFDDMVRPLTQRIAVFKKRDQLRGYAEQEARILYQFMGKETPDSLISTRAEKLLNLLAPVSEAERIEEIQWRWQQKGYDPKVDEKFSRVLAPKAVDPFSTGVAGGVLDVARMAGNAIELGSQVNFYSLAHRWAGKLTGREVPPSMIERANQEYRSFLDRLQDKYVPETFWFSHTDLKKNPEDIPWYAMENVANFAGGMSVQLAIGLLSGSFGIAAARGIGAALPAVWGQRATAGTYALLAGSGAYEGVYREALSQGWKDEDAKALGQTAGLISIPFSFFLNMKLDPVVRYIGKRVPGTIRGSVVAGAASEAVESGGERSIVEVFRLGSGLEPLTATNGDIRWAGFAASARNVMNEALLGAAAGGFMSGSLSMTRLFEKKAEYKIAAAEAMQRLYAKRADIFDEKDLYSQLTSEFGMNEPQARAYSSLVHQAMQTYQKRYGLATVEEAYADTFANHSEREDTSRVALTLKMRDASELFIKSGRLVGGEAWNKRFGKNDNLQPQAVLNFFRNEGVKKAELQWMGLNDFLVQQSAQGKKVSKKQIAEVISQERVRIELVRKGEEIAKHFSKQQQELAAEHKQLQAEIVKTVEQLQKESDPQKKAALEERYKQMIQIEDRVVTAHRQLESEYEQSSSQWASVRPEGDRSQYEEILIRLPQKMLEQQVVPQGQAEQEGGLLRPAQEENVFQSEHWGEPNVLVQMRFDVRPTAAGDAWHLIELQSDWNQEGRKQGFSAEEHEKKLKKAKEAYETALMTQSAFADQQSKMNADLESGKISVDQFNAWSNEWNRTSAEVREAYDNMNELVAGEEVAPNAFQETSAWVELSLKQLLLDAAKRGVKNVIWSPGNLQNTFQGVRNEKQAAGRAKFYDEFIPGVLEKLVKQLDPEAKIETTELTDVVDTTNSYDLEGVGEVEMRDSTFEELQTLVRRYFEADPAKMSKHLDAISTSTWEYGAYADLYQDLDASGNAAAAESLKAMWQSAVRSQYGDQTVMTVPLLRITDTMRAKILSEGLPLFMKDKAAAVFLDNGKAFMQALQEADPTAAIHELGHFMRRLFLDPADMARVEEMLGVVDGNWTVEAEEKFTEWFMQSLQKMESPIPELTGVFQTLREVFASTYRAAAGSELPPKLTDEMAAIISRAVVEDSDPVRARWLDYNSTMEAAMREAKFNENLRKRNKKDRAEDHEAQRLMSEIRLKNLQREAAAKRAAWQAEYRKRIGPKVDPGERRKLDIQDRIKHVAAADFTKLKSGVAQTLRHVQGIYQSINRLGDTPTTRLFKQLLDDVAWYSRMHHAQFDYALKQVAASLPRSVVDDLMSFDPKTWQTKWMSLLDDSSPVNKLKPDEKTEHVYALFQMIHDANTKAMVEEGVLRHMPDGSAIPTRDSMHYYLPRMLTKEGFDIFMNQPELFKLFVEKTKELNPDVKNPRLIEREFERKRQQLRNRRVGSMEFSRHIKHMPDVVVDAEGRRFNIFHNNPYDSLARMLDVSGNRIARIKFFGQSRLRNVYRSPRVMKDMLQLFREKYFLTAEELRDNLRPFMDSDKLAGLKQKDLQKLAKDYDLPLKITADEAYTRVMSLDPAKLLRLTAEARNKVEKELRGIAKKVGGIDTKAPIAEVLAGLKHRVSQDIDDFVYDSIKKAYFEEGGNPNLMDRVMADVDGIPRTILEADSAGRALKLSSTIIGSLHTSLAPLKGIWQTAGTVPGFAGWVRTMKAWHSLYIDYENSIQRAVDAGAMRHVVHTLASDESRWITRLSKTWRERASQIAGHEIVAQYNNAVAAEAGRLLANDWKRKFTEKDVVTARRLLLNEREIDELRSGRMSQMVYEKIIQGTVARSQETLEAPHRRGEAELNPFLKILFPYNSFALRQTRMIEDVLSEFKTATKGLIKAVKAKDEAAFKKHLPAFQASGWAGMTILASGLGVGTTIVMMMRALKHTQVDDDESIWALMGEGMVESGLLGMMNTPFSSAERATDGRDVILGMMPLVTAAGLFVNTFVGWGRYGNFGMDRRMGESIASTTPMLQTLRRQWDHYQNPDFDKYLKVKATVNRWKEDNSTSSPPRDIKLNPQYYPIWEKVARFDIAGAQEATLEYYKKMAREGTPPDDAIRGLRASLKARSPLNLGEENMVKFLGPLSSERRREYLSVHMRYMAIVDAVAPTHEPD